MSNDYEYHKRLKDIGTEVIVLDHHETDQYSDYAIVVNNQLSKSYPNKYLSGAGVVYKFLECIDDVIGIDNAKNYIDLAAIGIVGDMMSLLPLENRYLVNEGLKSIKNIGMLELIKKQSYSIGDINNITPTDISFYITPLINATIRVGKPREKEILFESLINGAELIKSTKRGAKDTEMETIAEQNARNCANARARQNRMKDKAIDQLDMKIIKNGLDENKIIFVEIENEDIEQTLTGLVAMQLMAKYKKPVIVARLADDDCLKGSARGDSKSELDSLKDFCVNSGYFEYAEGHAFANGISIKWKNVEPFINYANKALSEVDFNEGIYNVDFIRTPNSEDLADIILEIAQKSELWGKDIEEPYIAIENIEITNSDVSLIGTKKDTLKFSINGVTYLQFKADKLIEDLSETELAKLTILGRMNLNEWCGNTTPQIFIEDYNIEKLDLYSF